MATINAGSAQPDNTVRGTLLDILGPAPQLARDAHEGGEARMLIDGELVEGGSSDTFPNVDPATGEVLGQVADGTPDDLDRAIAAARRAFDETSWRRDGAFRKHCLEQLADAMRANADVLRAAVVAELGSPLRLTTNVQVNPVAEKLAFLARLADRWDEPEALPDMTIGPMRHIRRIVHEPLGVVGAVTPWNIPLDLPMAKVGGALAAGNTLVLKPAPDTPWICNLIGRLIVEETDTPPGVVNIVTSSDHALGATLTADPRIDAVSFTGSTATGRKVMAGAAEGLKRVHLELGGKNPSVVLDDVDLERTVPVAAGMGCFNAGQSCILPSRLLVPVSHLEDCLELAAIGMASVPVGDPWDPDVFMGPLIHEQHRQRVAQILSDGLEQGGRVICGGGSHPELRSGHYFEPTVIADVALEHPLVQEEIFGPVVVVQAYDDEADAVRLANGTPFGLAAYVWGDDQERAERVADQLHAGMVGINGGNFTAGDMPFGGVGHSGLGREWGVAGVEEFLDVKTVARAVPA